MSRWYRDKIEEMAIELRKRFRQAKSDEEKSGEKPDFNKITRDVVWSEGFLFEEGSPELHRIMTEVQDEFRRHNELRTEEAYQRSRFLRRRRNFVR